VLLEDSVGSAPCITDVSERGSIIEFVRQEQEREREREQEQEQEQEKEQEEDNGEMEVKGFMPSW
jgi:hypothetical protein